MKQIIIAVTYPGSPWYHEFMKSMEGCKYPIAVHTNPPTGGAYDAAGIYVGKQMYDEGKLDEFIVLHDSMIINDHALFDELFNRPGFVTLGPGGLMLIAKYVAKDLPPLPPMPQTKRASVIFELSYKDWIKWSHTIDPGFTDGPAREFKNGRENMIIENKYAKKYKGFWDISMVKE
jgi:hypothetical protein